MKRRRICVLVGLAFSVGCPNDLEPLDDGGDGGTIPPVVQEAFDRRCGFAGCHGMGAAQGGLSLDPAQSGGIVGGPSSAGIPMVTIGDVCASYLAIKLLPPENNRCGIEPAGALMPLGGRDNPDVQLDLALILGWIAGAPLPSDGGGGTSGTSDGSTTAAADTGTAGTAGTAGGDTGTAGTAGGDTGTAGTVGP